MTKKRDIAWEDLPAFDERTKKPEGYRGPKKRWNECPTEAPDCCCWSCGAMHLKDMAALCPTFAGPPFASWVPINLLGICPAFEIDQEIYR